MLRAFQESLNSCQLITRHHLQIDVVVEVPVPSELLLSFSAAVSPVSLGSLLCKNNLGPSFGIQQQQGRQKHQGRHMLDKLHLEK